MRKSSLLTICLFTFVVALLLLPGCKKSDSSPIGPEGSVSSLNANGTLSPLSRTQVQGTVFVTDQTGAPVTGLAASNFSAKLYFGTGIAKVTADSLTGVVSVQSTSQSGKKVAVAMTMDYSGSMFMGSYDTVAMQYNRILDMQKGVKAFVNAMSAGDAAEVIKFGSDVDFVYPFSSSKTGLLLAADSASYDRDLTALYQSIYKGLQDASALSASTYARAVVAFTDGGENNSSVSRADLFTLASANGIPVYTVGLIDSADHSVPPGLNSFQEEDLVAIADSTGGLYYYAPSASQLAQVYQLISGALSNATQVTITWPSTGLPASGTTVRAIITISYNGVTTQVVRTYFIP